MGGKEALVCGPEEIVVLTGSSGCLGHQTLKLLVGADERVGEIRCLDLVDPTESMRKAIEREQEEAQRKWARRKSIKRVRGDIRDVNIVERLLDGAHCVIHCAAKMDIWTENEQQDERELESINVFGTELLLKTCVRLGVRKFVHVSSFETFVSHHTIYYATENTIPCPKKLLFGASAESKRRAEEKVRQYSNNKLQTVRLNTGKPSALQDTNEGEGLAGDALNAVIIRFSCLYGEHDKHFVSQLLRVAKFFGGKLQRLSNVWIRQQPIYVGNAAWALIRAKQQMDKDQSISGEEFHITDDTEIGDPFDFLEPFVESKGMQVTKTSLSAVPIWLLILLFFACRRLLSSMDVFGLFTKKKNRLQEAIEKDQRNKRDSGESKQEAPPSKPPTRWYHMIKPEIFYFMCNSLFLNRTKASLRLNYEPLYNCEQSKERSLNWYSNHLEL